MIYVTGLYSGPSPSAGLGVARCLREGLAKVELVGVDFWSGSSGLHDPIFDRVLLKPSWDLIEVDLHAEELSQALAQGGAWLSTLDVEIAWLSRTFESAPGMLTPGSRALAQTVKPHASIGSVLPLREAKVMLLSDELADADVHEFCRRHSWRVWLKGPYHEALYIRSWRDLENARRFLALRWKTEELFLQAHVRGLEESVAFCAVNGKLVDAVAMHKRVTTPDGKTWAGRISDVAPAMLAAVETAVAKMNWTGGAEIEILRDADETAWLLEINPRFPAWIYGAAIAGRNLPAKLASAALGIPLAPLRRLQAQEFTRVVSEIPVTPAYPLPVPAQPDYATIGAVGKYGAALSSIVELLGAADAAAAKTTDTPKKAAPVRPLAPELARELDALGIMVGATPQRMNLEDVSTRLFDAALTRVVGESEGVERRVALSIKTAPDLALLRQARVRGFFAEAISALEVRRAVEAGFPPGEIVLNGPGKWWPQTEVVPDGLRAVFCDSVPELERLIASGRRDLAWGVRLRLPAFDSRFGIPVEEPEAFAALAGVLSRIPKGIELGVHFHMASSGIGVGVWLDAIESALAWAAALEAATGRAISIVDMGGGYHPDDLGRLPWPELSARCRERLPKVTTVIVEPGKALSQTAMALATRVLDVRRRDGEVEEIVVDASIAELPVASLHPHRLVRRSANGIPEAIGRGRGRVLGRICMEDDILAANVNLPPELEVGDLLWILDAGAYDWSMSYGFGRGGY